MKLRAKGVRRSNGTPTTCSSLRICIPIGGLSNPVAMTGRRGPRDQLGVTKTGGTKGMCGRTAVLGIRMTAAEIIGKAGGSQIKTRAKVIEIPIVSSNHVAELNV